MSWWRRLFAAARGPREVLAVDVSSYQTGLDWRSMADARPVVDGRAMRLELVIVKTSEGATVRDRRAARHAQDAARVGLHVQFYHFARADLGRQVTDTPDGWARQDARDEAAEFLAAVEATGVRPSLCQFVAGDADVWLDWEKATPRLTKGAANTWVRTWCEIVEAKGYRVGFYSGATTWRETLGESGEAAAHRVRADGSLRPFWAPDYGGDTGHVPDRRKFGPERRTPPGFQPPAIWQYTSRGAVYDHKQVLDLNLARVVELVRPA